MCLYLYLQKLHQIASYFILKNDNILIPACICLGFGGNIPSSITNLLINNNKTREPVLLLSFIFLLKLKVLQYRHIEASVDSDQYFVKSLYSIQLCRSQKSQLCLWKVVKRVEVRVQLLHEPVLELFIKNMNYISIPFFNQVLHIENFNSHH